jgi:hypothetical protein
MFMDVFLFMGAAGHKKVDELPALALQTDFKNLLKTHFDYLKTIVVEFKNFAMFLEQRKNADQKP